MFSIFQRRRHHLRDLIPDGMDRHCHLLWGVDDGASTPRESQAMINRLKACGFKGAWCTPHVMTTLPGNTAQALRNRYTEALELLNLDGFNLLLAAEYMMDEQFLRRHLPDELLTYDGKRLLVEFPQIALPLNWRETLFEIQSRGYIPVLAHPERYCSILSLSRLEHLYGNGVEFQLDIPALRGFWGATVRKRARFLLDHQFYSWAGTDAHHEEGIEQA